MQLEAARTSALPPIEATYKAREVEGWLDVHFYRKLGLHLANLFRTIGITPSVVTLLGGVFGVIAGRLYYYADVRVNALGMLLHVLANLFDNVDGQLARLTNSGSRTGRAIDSVVDHIIFINIYVHLGLRCLSSYNFWFVLLVTCTAGFSHALQAAAADYYRNAFLHFGTGRWRGAMDSSAQLRAQLRVRCWRNQPWQKFFLWTYLNFTREQEILSPKLARLRRVTDEVFEHSVPGWFQKRYYEWARPMFKWWSGLMTNTRMLVLFISLFAGQPMWFFWFELTVLNGLLTWLLFRQETMSKSLLAFVASTQAA
ncbi:MAG TPA: CDP-alcohol phosphatidyltransferase family protein [Chthoniobacterales bacterium]|nr:CDP-alcohol phosphatidyltransferase family protein [Chthoniobacterales bacterium]